MLDPNVICVAVINLAGGSGKSTLEKHLISSKLKSRRAAVEEVNAGDGTPDLKVGVGDIETLVVLLKKNEDRHVSIDFGASSGAALQHVLARYKRTVMAIDFWVIPVLSTEHSMDGAVKAVKLLRELGVDAQRIVVIPNRVEPGTSTTKLKGRFAPVYELRQIGVYVSEVPVFDHEVFESLKNQVRDDVDETVYTVAMDARDFRSLKRAARAAGDELALDSLAEREAQIEAAEFAVENLDAVWSASPLAAALAAEIA